MCDIFLMHNTYIACIKGISNNLMCKILDIQYTEDENIIFKTFCRGYGDLWLCAADRERDLKEKLLNRVKMLMELEQKNRKTPNNTTY